MLVIPGILNAVSDYAADFEEICNQIPDIYHPTYKDFALVENYLNNAERPYLKWLDTFYENRDGFRMDLRMRNMKLLDPITGRCDFKVHRVCFNQSEDNKEQCVVCYASFNHNYGYPRKILGMKKWFWDKNFKGHFLYQMGGWPNTCEGSLRLAPVPYAFKVCMMKEAKRLGYKKALWLDTSMNPQKNFNKLFNILERDGYILLSNNPFRLRDHGSEISRKSFGLTEDEYREIYQAVGGIIGINFDHPKGQALFEAWYQAARDFDPFLSPRSDQPVLGAIAYKLGLEFTATLQDICAIYNDEITSEHYFYINH
jgi:hypothetical protein